MREAINDPNRLQHILEAIDNVQEYMNGIDRETFDKDKIRIHAVAYNIQIIGEATYKLSKDFKATHPNTPWRLIEKMRHILVHDYFLVDMDFVWLVITEDLEPLKIQVQEYLSSIE